MLERIFNLLFPQTSLTGERGSRVSQSEWNSVTIEPYCELKRELEKRDIQFLDLLCSSGSYHRSQILQQCISMFKYKRVANLDERLAHIMLHGICTDIHSSTVLCPVPLHWSRQFDRGFNQAELLAHVIGKELNLKVSLLLKRCKSTGHQAWRDRQSRMESMHGVFIVHAPVPPRIILIDDVATTGATLDACAKVLKDAGCQYIEGWVIAHG